MHVYTPGEALPRLTDHGPPSALQNRRGGSGASAKAKFWNLKIVLKLVPVSRSGSPLDKVHKYCIGMALVPGKGASTIG
eukprot:1138574-Pelagomonas_calceolata.AAC.1